MLPTLGHCLRLCLCRFGSTVTQQGSWGCNHGGAEGERSFFCLTVSLHILHSGWTWREPQDLNVLEPVLRSRISDSVVTNQVQFLKNCNSERKKNWFYELYANFLSQYFTWIILREKLKHKFKIFISVTLYKILNVHFIFFPLNRLHSKPHMQMYSANNLDSAHYN